MAQRETIYRLRGQVADRLRPGSGSVTREPITGCIVVPLMNTGEQTFQGQVVTADFFVKTPAGTDIVASDRLEIRGEECEVDGVPADYGRKGVLLQAQRTGTV